MTFFKWLAGLFAKPTEKDMKAEIGRLKLEVQIEEQKAKIKKLKGVEGKKAGVSLPEMSLTSDGPGIEIGDIMPKDGNDMRFGKF